MGLLQSPTHSLKDVGEVVEESKEAEELRNKTGAITEIGNLVNKLKHLRNRHGSQWSNINSAAKQEMRVNHKLLMIAIVIMAITLLRRSLFFHIGRLCASRK